MAATSTAANITTRVLSRRVAMTDGLPKDKWINIWINIWMEGQIDGWSDNSERN